MLRSGVTAAAERSLRSSRVRSDGDGKCLERPRGAFGWGVFVTTRARKRAGVGKKPLRGFRRCCGKRWLFVASRTRREGDPKTTYTLNPFTTILTPPLPPTTTRRSRCNRCLQTSHRLVSRYPLPQRLPPPPSLHVWPPRNLPPLQFPLLRRLS